MGFGRELSCRTVLLVPLTFALAAAGCGGSKDGGKASPQALWYATCGDPVCSGYRPPVGVPPCTSEEAGAPCAEVDRTCDPRSDCNQLLVCATQDPTQQEGGCPISRRKYKRDIAYLDEKDLARYHDEVLSTRLATYRYEAAPETAPRRLGFIIDDREGSPAVLPNGDRVDLYGYASLSVAALQVQAREIEELRKKVKDLERELESIQGRLPAAAPGPLDRPARAAP